MGHGETHSFLYGFFHPLTQVLPWISLILAGLGILLAYAMYSKKVISPERIGSMFKPIYTMFYRKYWIDELYEGAIVRTALMNRLFTWFQAIDSKGIEGIVNGLANGTVAGGKAIRQTQTGQLQLYGLFIGLGIILILLVMYFVS
jgi:NADH-quinone oxidoreductase subunit L